MANPSADSSVFVTFFTEAVEFKAESEKEGRPIYKDVPFIRIVIPGDDKNQPERKASEEDKKRYPTAWAAYQRGESTANSGTPLEQWPQIKRSQVKEAKYFECHTVEQLASMSDANCQRLGMGFTDLRNKAKAYLEAAAGTAAVTAQAAENARLQQDIAALKDQIKALSDAQSRGPGRPRKEVAEA